MTHDEDMTHTAPPAATWWPSDASSGALAVVTGIGERSAVYDRFGRRLSADGYVVAVFEGEADAAAVWLEASGAGPHVLVGSDSGAAAVLRLLTQGTHVDGAVVAGLLVDSEAVLLSDGERRPCAHPIDAVPDRADLAAIDVPVLALHGGADTIAPLGEVVALLDAIPDLDFREVVAGLHDVLNDASHRSVAAAIVLWLERLRQGDARAPIVHRHPLRRFLTQEAG